MKKDYFKSIVKQAVEKKAFESLVERKNDRISENAKGTLIEYTEFTMAEYLGTNIEQLSIEERKWMFKCRVDDMDIKGNRRWQNEDIYCTSCSMNIEETQYHILNCKYLLGKNENLSYIPDYKDLFQGDITEQIYVARLLKENYSRRVST